MKTIRCNLRKTCPIFVTFSESFYRNSGIIYFKKSKIEEISLSIEFNSALKVTIIQIPFAVLIFNLCGEIFYP